MKLNTSVIPHYHCDSIPIHTLKQRVNINEDYLKEKSTWYEINGKLKYFKIRNDLRLFAEQFFCEFGREIIGLDTLEYEVASISSRNIKKQKAEQKLGLLSDNFQRKGYNYYLTSELLNSNISDLISYGDYTFSGLLFSLKQILSSDSYEKTKDFLIKLFISDAFTFQRDRNYHNIGFEIPRIENISYKQRLRPNLLHQFYNDPNLIKVEDGVAKLANFAPSKVYDNERILGLDHKNVIYYQNGMTWRTIFPFHNELLFETQEQADEFSQEIYEGLDPNLTELYMSYPKECKPLMERLAYDDEYRKILEHFSGGNHQINLIPKTQETFENILEDRRKQFQKVLKL